MSGPRFLLQPLRLVLAVSLVTVGAIARSEVAIELFVASQGDDAAAGTADTPLRTLEGARTRLRVLRAAGQLQEGEIRVTLREGTYFLSKAFCLTQRDSGTETAPLTFCAAPGEAVRLTAGRTVRQWQRVSLALAGALRASARSNVWVADLASQGISDFGELAPRSAACEMFPAPLELFCGEHALAVARWPNEGWAHVAALDSADPKRGFGVGDAPAARWIGAPDAWLHGFWTDNTLDSYEPLGEVDLDRQLVRTSREALARPATVGARFRVENVLSELDAPGEWYLDRTASMLYFWPPQVDWQPRTEVSLGETLICLWQVSHVRFQNLFFGEARVCGVQIYGGEDNRVEKCQIRNCGNLAVTIEGGHRHAISRCHIERTGDGAIRVEGGDRDGLTPAEHEVTDNHITDFARTTFAHRPAVSVYGVGVVVAHNRISRGPHAAIALEGDLHRVEFNEIVEVARETDAVGAICLGHDWTERGNVLRHNWIHDLGGTERRNTSAILLDHFASGTTVVGNLCERTGAGVVIGGGRDNRIENNLLIGCDTGIVVDLRGAGWARGEATSPESELGQLLSRHANRDSSHRSRWPELEELLSGDRHLPKNNCIERNVCDARQWLVVDEALPDDALALTDNFLSDEALTVSTQGERLPADSPAYTMGFRPIPLLEIGPRAEQARLARFAQ